LLGAAFKEKVQKKVADLDDLYDLRRDDMREYMVEPPPPAQDPAASKLLTQVCWVQDPPRGIAAEAQQVRAFAGQQPIQPRAGSDGGR
jgi:hypothetical protein